MSNSDAAQLEDRREDLGDRVVPYGVRFLTAAIDVQESRFVVQVHGWGVDLEQWIIDRFALSQSPRTDRHGNRLPLDPAVHLEDWDLLIDEVLERQYSLGDGSGWRMAVKLAACSVGIAGDVTERAYDFHGKLERRGMRDQFMVLPGDDRAESEGSPVHGLSVATLKDQMYRDLERTDPRPGYVHFPQWLTRSFFEELVAERHDERKGWIRVAPDKLTTAIDLMVYNRVAAVALDAERIDWDHPPTWAAPWDQNTLVLSTEGHGPRPTAA